ncbi:MAG: putative flagellar basal-body rod protein flgB [Microvirga sp.]|jgi:flagellar basal body rod protein FlgB|nr:putative flagellar basal-body rod protein flgB [Microvirga sp.]
MSSNVNLVIGVLDAAMRLQELRAQVASRNIAVANTPDSRAGHVDIQTELARLREALADPSRLAQVLEEQRSQGVEGRVSYGERNSESFSLDAEVTELTSAGGRYQALAEGLSRQFALMQLAMDRRK